VITDAFGHVGVLGVFGSQHQVVFCVFRPIVNGHSGGS
jgi:hypothetical protein